jgi:hypothetical protein
MAAERATVATDAEGEVARMEFLGEWIIDYLVGRVGQSDDYMPRTWLGWTRVGLLAGLIGQIIYLIKTAIALSVPTFLWFSILANVVALIVVVRALRWRYPV